MPCQIKISIEENGRTILAGHLGLGLNWTALECAFIVRAMTTVVEGSSNGLLVNTGLARCFGIVKTIENAAEKIGVSKNTFDRMMSREIKKAAA